MSSQNSRPKWWQVYLTVPLLIALFTFETRLRISQRGHQAVQVGIVLLIYGLVHLWLKANSRALSQMDRTLHDRTIRKIHIPVAKLPEARKEKSSIIQLSDREIQGLLGDAMDMSYVDAESSKVDKVRRN